MQLEDLITTPQLSVKLNGSFFNIVNFTPVIEYIHNLSIDKISEFDDELKFNNKQHKKYISFLDLFIKKFPVIVLQEPIPFNDFKKKLKCNGISEELNILLMRRLNKIQANRFYFSKLQYFCKYYELTFLDKTYFNDIRNKLSLL